MTSKMKQRFNSGYNHHTEVPILENKDYPVKRTWICKTTGRIMCLRIKNETFK